MGNVNFNTLVEKTVDIDKTVNLEVIKNVTSTVDVQGNLATAEASADAVGFGDGTATGERTKVPFTIDGFSDTQLVTANAVSGPNPASDGPILVTDSDIAGLQRTLFTEILSVPPDVDPAIGIADLGINNPQPGKIDFSQSNNSYSNAFADYEVPGGVDPFPLDDNDGIVDDYNTKVSQFVADNGIDPLTPEGRAEIAEFVASDEGPCYTFTFSDIDWDPGQGEEGQAATLRVSFWVEDTSGNQALTTVLFVPGTDGTGFEDLSITAPIAGFIDEGLVAPLVGTFIAGDATNGGIVALGTEDDVDNGVNGGSVDFDNLERFQILLEDDPEVAVGGNPFSSADVFLFNDPTILPSGIEENKSVDGTDASAVFEATTCIQEEEFGLLAETDTFAQVEPGGAFSFSESLAAATAIEENFGDLG